MQKPGTLSTDQVGFFREHGYVIVRNVYKPEDLVSARGVFDKWFREDLWKRSPYDSRTIINDIYSLHSGLAPLFFNEAYFNAIRSLLGENIIFLPECAVHRNRYIDWHKDTTSQEADGFMFHKKRNDVLLQCAVYFQDNTASGGGLTVIPGSQYTDDRFVHTHRPRLPERVRLKIAKMMGYSVFDRIEKTGQAKDLDTTLGDLLLFDLRIDHRSTFERTRPARDKYAVFNTAGAPGSSVMLYQDYLKSREEPYYHFLRNHKLPEVMTRIGKQFDVTMYY